MNCNTERGRDCTVSAMIDGGPDNLLGTFLIVSYSVAYATLTVVADGLGQRATMQVDHGPWSRRPSAPAANVPTNRASRASSCRRCWRLEAHRPDLHEDDSMVGPLTKSLNGFAAQYQRAVEAQRR